MNTGSSPQIEQIKHSLLNMSSARDLKVWLSGRNINSETFFVKYDEIHRHSYSLLGFILEFLPDIFWLKMALEAGAGI